MSHSQYVPARTKCNIGGVAIKGFAADTFITITKDEDSFALSKGINGETTRTLIVDNCYTVEITLMRSSKSNDYLSALCNADMNPDTMGAGVVPVFIQGDRSRETFVASQAYIVKLPDEEYNNGEDGSRTWQIQCVDGKFHAGGA